MTLAVRRLFNKSWSVVWATTYTCGVVAFDEYFLGQLRPDGLNVTILADLAALDESWAAMIETAALSRLRRVNREYLLRPVAWHSHAFHPKTYLFGNETGGILLVGSGNADLAGLVAGYEVFSRFDSNDQSGAEAIATWRDWMETLVRLLGDPVVGARWSDAAGRLPWLNSLRAGAATPIVTNLDAPIIDRFLAGIEPPVNELHVSAPFWDDQLAALTELLDRARPRSLHVYLGAGSHLDGKRLLRLISARQVAAHFWTYTEPRFVHAKLVACVSGDSGRVLSGSANLSHVAMLADAQKGNVEMGVIAEATAAQLRDVFKPAGMGLRPLGPDEVLSFTPELRSEELRPPLRLLRAERLPDGHLSLAMTPFPGEPILVAAIPPDTEPQALSVVRSEGTALYEEIGRARTEALWESPAALIHLVDTAGRVVSNAVAVDDPEALTATLRGREQHDRGALADLAWEELDTRVGRILEELQGSCLFEPRGARRTQRPVVDEATESDAFFWQRLGAMDLEAVDQGQRGRFGRGRLDSDPIFAQLRAMLIEAPYLPELRPIRAFESTDEEADDPDAARHRWAVETRLRLRIFNILKRWCRAVRDPEILALDPMISTHNYRALLQALGELWRGDGDGGRYFTEDHLQQLLEILLQSLLGRDGVNKGALQVADPATRIRMVADLREHGATAPVADLLFDVLRPARQDRITTVLKWQPLLIAAIAEGVVEPAAGPVADTLGWAAGYVDEDGWRRQIRERFGVDAEFSSQSLAPGYEYMLEVTGIDSLLADPRALGVLQSALRFRPALGVLLALGKSGNRVSLLDGERVFARINGEVQASQQPVSMREILQLPSDAALGSLLDRRSAAAADA